MKKKLLFIVNVDWFFISHRLPIALAAIQSGYDVYLACQITDKQQILESYGIKVMPIPLTRTGTSLFTEIKSLASIYQCIRKVNPDILHLVTIKPVLYGGIITRFVRIPRPRIVASISGLGYIFIASDKKTKLFKTCIVWLYKVALSGKNTAVIFQNTNDSELFIKNKIITTNQIRMTRGSGVDLENYVVTTCPEGIPIVIFMARLLKDKGILEFVEAARLLKKRNQKIRMVLVGQPDSNPKSVDLATVSQWENENTIEYWGHSTNAPETISNSTIVVLPSYREGLPKILIEAAACGRAVITTDVPGCRDAIIPNITGLLVPPKNAHELAAAIEKLTKDIPTCKKMGAAGRLLAEKEFSIVDVINIHLAIYSENIPS